MYDTVNIIHITNAIVRQERIIFMLFDFSALLQLNYAGSELLRNFCIYHLFSWIIIYEFRNRPLLSHHLKNHACKHSLCLIH